MAVETEAPAPRWAHAVGLASLLLELVPAAGILATIPAFAPLVSPPLPIRYLDSTAVLLSFLLGRTAARQGSRLGSLAVGLCALYLAASIVVLILMAIQDRA